ncbi:hypothetical protein BDR07DRAFT_1534045 [Suillus spraguei]|nr:hypothetical protein BDR07DRAFT_1534045 [Suillus spraguei]
MLTIASAEPHPDLQGTLKKIKKGGKKAQFALPTLYQPNSLIPLEIWKASPTTTNDNDITLLGELCEDFTTTRTFALVWTFSTHLASTPLTIYLPMLIVQNELLPDKSLPSEGNTSFACAGLTLPSVEAQPPNSLLIPSSTVIPVSTFSTLTYALTAGARLTDHRARSPSSLPTTSIVHLHISPTRDQLSTFSTLQGAVE